MEKRSQLQQKSNRTVNDRLELKTDFNKLTVLCDMRQDEITFSHNLPTTRFLSSPHFSSLMEKEIRKSS